MRRLPKANPDYVDFGAYLALLSHRPVDEFDEWQFAFQENNPLAFAPEPQDTTHWLHAIGANHRIGERPNCNPWRWEDERPELAHGDTIPAYARLSDR